MTVKELVEQMCELPEGVKWKTNPDAVVYVYADHGQTGEQVEGFSESRWTGELPYFADQADGGYRLFKHPDDLKELKEEGDDRWSGPVVTAIEIG